MYSTFYKGAHMPLSNVIGSLEKMKEMNGNFMQIFVSSKFGKAKANFEEYFESIGPDVIDYCNENDMKIVIHSPYVINLAKPFDECLPFIEICLTQIRAGTAIGSIGYVIHVGKHLKLDVFDATTNMLQNMKHIANIMREESLTCKLILETGAGQGTEMFICRDNSLAPLSDFYNMFTAEEKEFIGICVDTCHIFSGGFDISSKRGVRYFFLLFDSLIGLEHLALIHLNDSKTELGGCVDRHENIGKGKINIKGLHEFVKQAKKFRIPTVLETPDETKYENEIKWIDNV
jgi:deoxyribonuclease IV